MQNDQGQGRGIRIYRETLGLGFQMGPIGLGWAGPKHESGCVNIFRNKCSRGICLYTEQSEIDFGERTIEQLIRPRVWFDFARK
jgi:hypothetical protein